MSGMCNMMEPCIPASMAYLCHRVEFCVMQLIVWNEAASAEWFDLR
jgi:hypothetical protein